MSFDLTSENNTCEIKEVGKIMTTENDLWPSTVFSPKRYDKVMKELRAENKKSHFVT